MIEDTTFIVDILRGDLEALKHLEEIERRNIPEKVSAITALELYEGLYQIDKSEPEKQSIRDVIRSKNVLAADHDVMKEAGHLSGQLLQTGQQVDREDCIIAATALKEGEPVLTRNNDHFERIPGLGVETY